MQNGVNDIFMIVVEVIVASLIINLFMQQLNLYKGVVTVHNNELENQQLQELYVKYNKYDNTVLSDYEVISMILTEVPYEKDYFYVEVDNRVGASKVIDRLMGNMENAQEVRTKAGISYNTKYDSSLIIDGNGEIMGVRVVKKN